jgi:hypothetical protein
MVRRYVRAEFADPRGEWDALFIDLVVDAEMTVVTGPPICGWWGKARSEGVWPFVAWCNSDGAYVIDFGEWNEEGRESRYRGLRLDDRLTMGSVASFDEDDEPVSLRLRKVTDIAAGLVILD